MCLCVVCGVGAFATVDPLHATLALHPLALAGIWGVTINALSLLPLGRQDGARMVEALVGKRSASFASSMTFWGLIAAGTTTQPHRQAHTQASPRARETT